MTEATIQRNRSGQRVSTKLLLVDDEEDVLRMLERELQFYGFETVTANGGYKALKLAELEIPDLIVLDIGLPDLDGIRVLEKLRTSSAVPVILLTARGSPQDRILGLNHGADDYIAKPFSPNELVARTRAILRSRNAAEKAIVFRAGRVVIELDRRLARKDDALIPLTRNEWALLQHLSFHAEKVVLFNDLLRKVWGDEYEGDLAYLRVWVSRLRQKIEEEPSQPELIKTVAGVGYYLALTPEPPPGQS